MKNTYIFRKPYHRTELWQVCYKGWILDLNLPNQKTAKKFLRDLSELDNGFAKLTLRRIKQDGPVVAC